MKSPFGITCSDPCYRQKDQPHLWHREILGRIRALLVMDTEHPYSVAINCVLWSSRGFVPNCLFKKMSRASSHETIAPSALLPRHTAVPPWAPGGEGRPGTHNIPEEVGQPVGGRAHTADKLQVLGFCHPLLNQVKDKAGWNEGHGENHADGEDNIHRGGQPAAGPEAGDVRNPGKAQRKLWAALIHPHPSLEAHHLTELSSSRLSGYFCRLPFLIHENILDNLSSYFTSTYLLWYT